MAKKADQDLNGAFSRLKALCEKSHGHGLVTTEEELTQSQADLQTVGDAIGYDEEEDEQDVPARKPAAKRGGAGK